MNKSLILLALTCVGAGADITEVKGVLEQRISGSKGTVSLYAKNLDTGVAVGIRGVSWFERQAQSSCRS